MVPVIVVCVLVAAVMKFVAVVAVETTVTVDSGYFEEQYDTAGG